MISKSLVMMFSLISSLAVQAATIDELEVQVQQWEAEKNALDVRVEETTEYTNRSHIAYRKCLYRGNCNQPAFTAIVGQLMKNWDTLEAEKEKVITLDAKIVKGRAELQKIKSEKKAELMLATQGVRVDLSNLRAEINDQQLMILKLEQQIDRDAAGIYLQNKFLAFMNSQVACSMIDRCQVKGKSVITKDRLKEIFPTVEDKNILTGDFYHQRAYEQKKSPAPSSAK